MFSHEYDEEGRGVADQAKEKSLNGLSIVRTEFGITQTSITGWTHSNIQKADSALRQAAKISSSFDDGAPTKGSVNIPQLTTLCLRYQGLAGYSEEVFMLRWSMLMRRYHQTCWDHLLDALTNQMEGHASRTMGMAVQEASSPKRLLIEPYNLRCCARHIFISS